MSKPLEEVDPNENPAAAAFQQIKFEEETPEGVCMLLFATISSKICIIHTISYCATVIYSCQGMGYWDGHI